MNTTRWIQKLGGLALSLAGTGLGWLDAAVWGRGCIGPAGIGCTPDMVDYVCHPPTVYWAEPLDVDGDGQADFEWIFLRVIEACAKYIEDPPRTIVVGRIVWNVTEALFPAPGVEVYVLPFPLYIKGVRIPMWPQEPIEPEPALVGSLWEWHTPETLPYLNAYGLGHTARTTETMPCLDPKGICREGSNPGVLENEDITEAIIGFRLPKADGWHLGWVQVRMRPGWGWVGRPWLEVVDWAVHPEPDTALRAGEHPRPALAARRDGSEVVLSWPLPWTGWVLERQRAVRGAAWEAVPGVTNHTVRLPAADGPWFFRLRGP